MKRLTTAALSATLAAVLVPSVALACGGLFCDAIQLIPVQQNAERILFEVNPDGTITTTVEINYAGSPEDFSWVLPVPSTPTLDVDTPADVMTLLDDATQPTVIPQPTKCTQPPSMRFPGGMNSPSAGADDDDFDSAAEDGGDGVNVEELPQVGPYASIVVSSDDPDELVTWLNDNGYLITPEMEPFVADYVAQGMKFLAVQLSPEAGTQDITPLGMTYAASAPMIPLSLTAVGAAPEMGVMAFIAADSLYGPDNIANISVAADDLRNDPRDGTDNYYPTISKLIDAAGGEGMITQWSGSVDSAIDTAVNRWSWQGDYEDDFARLEDIRNRFGNISRIYGRVSAAEIQTDPSFAAVDAEPFDGIYDLSDRAPLEMCAISQNQIARSNECGDMYCGTDASCATTELGEGCVCPTGFNARVITESVVRTQGVRQTVVCEDASFELIASALDGSVSFAADPCLNNPCGPNGECQPVNGFPTCACDEDYAAVANGGTPVCAEVQRLYDDSRLLPNALSCGSCNAGADAPGAGLAVLFLGLLGITRRRAA